MTTEWGWKPEKKLGIWRYGATWMRPIVAAIPYITVLFLLVMMYMIGGTMTTAKGVLFTLPDTTNDDGENAELVALVMPVAHDTIILFDDSRYILGDVGSERAFIEHLSECADRSESRVLLIMADRRIAGGEIMKIASIVKQGGILKVLFAERHEAVGE